MSGPTINNRKGMFENAEIRNNIVKPYLRFLGVDPLGQNPLPDVENLKPLAGLRRRVEETMMWQGYMDGPWFYKGAKMCLFWPEWHRAFPDAKWVIVRRADEDIIRSCMKAGFMRGYRDQEGWQGWINEHKKRFREMEEAGLNLVEIWPAEFVDGNFSQAKHMINKLGLKWNDRKVKKFITPELWSKKDGS
jgi:hypothetical protein